MALTAYCFKTKTKNTPFAKPPVIDKNGKRYMAKGVDKDGNVMCKVMGEPSALEALKNKEAVKGEGW